MKNSKLINENFFYHISKSIETIKKIMLKFNIISDVLQKSHKLSKFIKLINI